jgi:hypothetical protein
MRSFLLAILIWSAFYGVAAADPGAQGLESVWKIGLRWGFV